MALSLKEFIQRVMRTTPLPSSAASPKAKAFAPVSAPVAAPPPATPGVPPPAPDLDFSLKMLQTITEALDDGDLRDLAIEIPARALWCRFPDELRGPRWDADLADNLTLPVPGESLLKQLKTGQIKYPVSVFREVLPVGWLREGAGEETVEVDLAMVVESLPADMLKVASRISDALTQTSGMHDYFKPAAVGSPVVSGKRRPGRTSAAGHPKYILRVHRKSAGEWNGIESGWDAAPFAVDINRAGEDQIRQLPRAGVKLARLIVEYRAQHGPFRSIFDLAAVPGLGRRRFAAVTGLSVLSRRNRNETLMTLLGIGPEERLSLSGLLERARVRMQWVGCVLASIEGLPVAWAGSLRDRMDHYAVHGANALKKSSKSLRALQGGTVDIIALPAANPPLLLLRVGHLLLVALTVSGDHAGLVTSEIIKLREELGWLLSPRAVVAEQATGT